MTAARRGAPSEKQTQHAIRVLCEVKHWQWYDLSQPRATMQTAGLCDGILFCPRLVMVEVKSLAGRQTLAQRLFQAACERAGVAYVVVRTAFELVEALEALEALDV
jgi:hypothetical protein